MVFTRVQTEGGRKMGLFAQDLTQEGRVMEIFSSTGTQSSPEISPDGRYLLYTGQETGRDEIHVRTFPDGQGHWQVSPKGGTRPRWSAAGDRVYYLEGDALVEVDAKLKPSFSFGAPKKIFDLEGNPPFTGPFDVSPDGRTFAFIQEFGAANGVVTSMTFVEHWAEELARRKPH
jgi:dipeptidyl aminopeptidase/acylaminoacyl peptidase